MVGAVGFVVDFGIFNLAHALGFGAWVAAHVLPSISPALAAALAQNPAIIEQTLSLSIAIGRTTRRQPVNAQGPGNLIATSSSERAAPARGACDWGRGVGTPLLRCQTSEHPRPLQWEGLCRAITNTG